MKKFLSVFLTVLLVFAATTVIAFGAGITTDDQGIYCTDLLDFNKDTNDLWAQFNEETGRWECKFEWNNYEQPMGADGKVCAPLLRPYSSFSAHRWYLTEDGEVFRFESTDSSIYPGISFVIDDMQDGIMQIGKESGNPKKAEYVKIRVRNHSVCDQITFGFVLKNTNNGNFVSATISELTVDEDGKKYGSSGEWETYTFSMATINQNTNYDELLYDPTNPEDTPKSRWGGQLFELLVFPFGYNVTDGTGNYPGAAMDIDYIVIGSRNYVDNYQSALEIKEGNIQSLELVKAPTKTSYRVGESLDLDGLELKATYKDGTVETLETASASVSTFESVVDTVTLKFGKESVSFPVSVVDITGIEVNKVPEDTVFEVAELADGFISDGYQIKVNYADGTSKISDITPSAENGAELANSSFAFDGDFTTAGTKTVTVYYFGKSTTFDVTTIQVSDLEVTAPTKTYRYNTKTSADDFGVTFVYTDGSKLAKADASIEFEYTLECQVKVPGTTVAVLTAKNDDYGLTFTKEVNVEIATPTGVEVTTPPRKTEYQPDETFNIQGMVVTLIYADGTKVNMDNNDLTTRVDTSEPGTKNVTIRTNIEGLKDILSDAKLKTQITVLGDVAPEDPGTSDPGTSEPIENIHENCKPNGFQKFWNAIVNFFRRLFGKAEICAVCGKEK